MYFEEYEEKSMQYDLNPYQYDREDSMNRLHRYLHYALGEDSLESIDIWDSLNQKLNPDISTNQPISSPISSSTDSIIGQTGHQVSLWLDIIGDLDEQYHKELWSESAKDQYTARHKYILGLSEYIDQQCSSTKAQIISEHLLACGHCRKLYLNLNKLSKIVDYTYSLNMPALNEEYNW